MECEKMSRAMAAGLTADRGLEWAGNATGSQRVDAAAAFSTAWPASDALIAGASLCRALGERGSHPESIKLLPLKPIG